MYKIMIAAIIESIDPTRAFNKWPHHVTIIPWFLAKDLEKTTQQITSVCNKTPTIHLTIGKTADFGKQGKIRVSLLNKSKRLVSFHNKLLASLGSSGIAVKSRHIGKNYTPHISHKGANHPIEGQMLELGEVSLVESTDEIKMTRKVITTLPLRRNP